MQLWVQHLIAENAVTLIKEKDCNTIYTNEGKLQHGADVARERWVQWWGGWW